MIDYNVTRYTGVPSNIQSSIQSFENVKKLTKHVNNVALEEETEVFKDSQITTYSKAKEYVLAITEMISRASEVPTFEEGKKFEFPTVYINAVSGVISRTEFNVDQMADTDGDYQKIISDLSYYTDVLKNSVMMEYLTEIIDIKVTDGQTSGDEIKTTESFISPSTLNAGVVPVIGSIEPNTKIITEIRPES